MQKSVLFSKTFWLNILAAVTPLLPVVGEWVQANVVVFGMLWGAAGVVLRFITKDKVVLID